MANNYYKVPPKIILTGDTTAGERFVGLGMKRLNDLVTSMSFRDLKQDVNNLRFDDGTHIKTIKAFGNHTIEIFVPHGGLVSRSLSKECMCGPCLAFGIITAIRAMTIGDFYLGLRYQYDVSVCVDGAQYMTFSDDKVRSPGFEKYYVGQFVLVTFDVIDPDLDILDCCADKSSCVGIKFDEDEGENYIMITPYVIPPMVKWSV